jgi:endonuclease III
MNGLKELEIKKLINEIIFLKENLKVVKEISIAIEKEFNKEISKQLNLMRIMI